MHEATARAGLAVTEAPFCGLLLRNMLRPAPDTAFAVLALLRCRNRLEQVLCTIAEPRRSELQRVVSELAGFDDGQLSRLLRELVRREDSALMDTVAGMLGAAAAVAPLAIRRWIARGACS